jgi:DNA mismatch endonuclease (patch repair protein)
VAVFVDGSFWHGHPSKWQPDRWKGYWDEKIKRNIARDARHNAALRDAGWLVIRVWDFEVEHEPAALAARIRAALSASRTRPRSRPVP